MNTKEKIQKITKILFGTEEQEQEVTFVDVKTDDGKILRLDDIAVDQVVQEVSEDGLVEVEDGTYVLEGGASIVVVDGVITEVIEGEEEEATEEEVIEEEMAVEEVVEESNEDAILKALENVAERIGAIESKFTEQDKEVKAKLEEFGKSASVEHTKTKVEFKEENIKPKSKLHIALGMK